MSTDQSQVLKLKLWLKSFQQTEVQDQLPSQANCIKHLRRGNTYPSEMPSVNCRGRNTPKLILQGHHHPDTKTRQRYHKKRENYRPISLMNIDTRHKNPQQKAWHRVARNLQIVKKKKQKNPPPLVSAKNNKRKHIKMRS